ncbi:MAG: hypothetical protein JRG69_06260 [Deltaproteobacteria bacterium]|nr:hypothetical protein [Deltaproteobacteria bacterium]
MSITVDPEHESIATFVEYMMDDEQEVFSHADLNQLAAATQTSNGKVRAELESFGLRLARRERVRHIRGVNTNSNDRFCGPGSEKMHGGSGWEQINGFSGQEG